MILLIWQFWSSIHPKKIEKLIGNKNIKLNIFKIQINNPILCGYFCNGFIGFMFAGKTLIEYISLFLSYDLKRWQCNS